MIAAKEQARAGALRSGMAAGAVAYIDAEWIPADGSGDVAALVVAADVGSSRVDLQACKLEYSIVSPK